MTLNSLRASTAQWLSVQDPLRTTGCLKRYLTRSIPSLLRHKSTLYNTGKSKVPASAQQNKFLTVFEKAVEANTGGLRQTRSPKTCISRPLSHRRRQMNDPHYLYASLPIRTSLKKLLPLARQIAHKTVDHAILQMHFSIKKASAAIETALIKAKKTAIKDRGLDKESLFVDEAWVGRQTPIKYPYFKGRMRFAVHQHRRTKIFLLLKDKDTIIRKEKENRRMIYKRASQKAYRDKNLYNKSEFFTC